MTRFQGAFAGALAGAAVLVVALFVGERGRSALAPGPLARPHAALDCVSCHLGANETSAASACATCHGERTSTRAGHRDLALQGRLGCNDCHSIHRSETGLAFEADGSVWLYRTGSESKLRRRTGEPEFGAPATEHVPLIQASTCASCHDPRETDDVAAHCFGPRGAGGFALCFDEHRRPAHVDSRHGASRDADVEAARMIAVAAAAPSGIAALLRNGAYLAVALGAALGVAALERRRRAQRPPSSTVSPAANHLASVRRRLPVIDASRCLGCHACVDVCPYDALVVRRYVAVLARPDDCCGAETCRERCPNGSLTLQDGELVEQRPRLDAELQSLDRPGVYLAGDVTSGSLIRNAVRQGARVAESVARALGDSTPGSSENADCDLLVIGAGPAGLSAALRARELSLRVIVLEQASIAESIRRFSRKKLVLDAGSEDERLPLFVADAEKEELLARWMFQVRTARLDVREGARVVAVESSESSGQVGFRVRAHAPGGTLRELTARRVLLAVGSRGTPRKLQAPVPASAESRVHYELSDARAFAGRRAVVVGLGDVAMESAVALAAQPATSVTVLHRGQGFRRGKRRNIDALGALVAAGRVELVLDAEIECVGTHRLTARVAGTRRDLPYDALFVHIGALPARELVERVGVCFPR